MPVNWLFLIISLPRVFIKSPETAAFKALIPVELLPELPTFSMWAKYFMPHMAKEGYNATQALREYRAQGGMISNKRWYDEWRRYGKGIQYSDVVSEWEPYRPIPSRYRTEASPFRREPYSMVYEIEGVDPETGEPKREHVTITSKEDRLPGYFDSELEKRISQIEEYKNIRYTRYRRISYITKR